MKKIRFGLIGCGRISEQHFKSINLYSKRSELKAVCDIEIRKAKQSAKLNKIDSWYKDYREMLERDDIDIISVCTPNGLHKKMAIDIANSGKHTLIEKPLALKSKDVDMMIQAFFKNKKKIFSVLQVRHNPPVKFAKKFLENKKLGKITFVNLNIYWYRPKKYFKDTWRGTKKLDGGSLLNQGIHYIDIMQWLMGGVERVYSAKVMNLCHKIEIEDSVMAIVKLKNGGWGSINFTLCCYPKNSECSLNIIGEKGNFRLGGAALNEIEAWNIPSIVKPNLKKSIKPNRYAKGMYQGSCPYHFLVYRDVLNSLQNNRHNLIDAKEARKSIEIVESIYKLSK